jgi:imidazolonepropionase-like amidohydrolase
LSDEVGTVRPGLLADLLLFDRDPAEDLEVLGRPVSVMQRGKIVHGRLP